MTDVGTMQVTFTGDVSQLGSAVAQAMSDLNSVGDAAQSTGETASGGFMGAIGSVVDFGAKIGQTIFGVQALASGAVNLASSLLGPAESAETMQTAFTTLMGSTQAANAELAKLDAFASHTPFQTMDIDQAASQLIGFGINANDVIPDLTAIGDALSAVGKGSTANLDSIVDIFGKIQTGGGLTVGIMQELSRDGINAWSIMEQQTGKSKDQLTTMIQQGLIPAKDAMHDLTAGIEKNPLYTGGMAKQSNTMTGIISTLKSNWDQMMVSFGTPILKALEPDFAKLATAISSPAFKEFASDTGKAIVTVIGDMATDFGDIVSTGQEVISFFQKNQVAMDALGAVVIGLGIGLTLFAMTQIPAMVIALGAWAVAQWAVLVPLLATAAPFILIGLLVAAVVFGIILAVQHWGAISTWLSGVWNTSVHAVGDFFSWLGDHLHQILDNIGGFFHTVWNGILDFLKIVGITLLAIIIGPIGLAVIYIVTHWTQIKTFLAGIWSDITGAATSAWHGLTTGISNALIGMWNWVNTFFGGLPGQMLQFGINIIQGLINGIASMIGNVENTMGNIVSTIGSFLPHSPAKQGELSHLNEYGPSLVKGFASGIDGSASILTASVAHMVSVGTYPIKPSASAVASSVNSSSGSSGSSGGASHTTVVELDGTQLAKIVQKHTDQLVRLKLGPKGRVA